MSRIQWEEEAPPMTRIKVIGVGGGGCNAVTDMVDKGFAGVEFYAVNTDLQALKNCKVSNQIQIGDELTHGQGAGANPELGENAARQAEAQIRTCLEGADMVFVTAGMGGGTGTGAAPVIAEFARSMGILCVAIVTKPFTFEGPQRMRRALQGIKRLKDNVDTMIVIMNDKLMETVGPKTPLREAFTVVNGVLAQGIRAISDLISMPGLINVDFRDVRTIMGETGGAVMGVGIGKGENRATEAVRKACHSPLQEKIVIDGARGVLINITGGADITMHEINEATSLVYESADQDANIIFGVVIDEKMKDEMRVTIIATGFNEGNDPSAQMMEPQRFRRGPNIFAQSPVVPEVNTAESRPQAQMPAREPDYTPAVQRKREREVEPERPTIDFRSESNPLAAWDEPLRQPAPQAGAAAQPQAPAPQAAPEPAQPVSGLGFRDPEPASTESEPAEQDPYEIPAINRRRKHFFE